MKHLLLFAFIATFVQTTAFGQCTPNPQYANAGYGFYPDSTTFITTEYAVAGSNYDAVINVKTLADTVVNTIVLGTPAIIQIWHSAMRINTIQGLPAGFSYSIGGSTVSNDSTWENTGSGQNVVAVQGCLQITASASAVSAAAPFSGYTDYPLTMVVDPLIEESDQLNSLLAGKWYSELTSLGWDAFYYTDYVIRIYAVDPNTPCTPPTVLFTGLNASYSLGDGASTLTGAPSGGTFYGPGIDGNQFDPAVAGTGTHGVTYVYEDPANNCVGAYALCTTVDVQVTNGNIIDDTEGMEIYPNPSNGEYNLSIKEMNGVVSYSVYDAKGSEVRFNSFVAKGGVQETFNLSELSAGSYTMVLNTPAGQFTQKLVKQ